MQTLYLLISLSENRNPEVKDNYLISRVSSEDIADYMQRRDGLKDIFNRRGLNLATINNGRVSLHVMDKEEKNCSTAQFFPTSSIPNSATIK